MSDALPLEGVQLLVPQLYTGPLRSRMHSVLEPWQIERQLVGEELIPYAQALGAVTIDDVEGNAELYRKFSNDPTTFALFASDWLMTEKDEAIRRGSHDDVLVRLRSKPIGDCTVSELCDTPYVLSSVEEQGGTGKYLIERAGQVRRIMRALRSGLFGPDERPYERREFVPTPGEHYTSYRLVVAPTGEILAAGLIYSAHTKHGLFPKRVRMTKGERGDHRILFGSRPQATYRFEDPASRYFLRARDVRSNMAEGGGCIPLLGENRRKPTTQEKEILQQVGIDPANPALPEALMTQGDVIAKIIGLAGGVAVGADYIQDARTGQFPILEVNFGIGVETLRECWLAGDKSVKDIELRIELGKRMLHSITRQRQTSANV